MRKGPKGILEVVERLGNEPIDMLEINISCPNVKEGGIAFGQDPKHVEESQKLSQKDCKTAGDHEANPECNRYYRDGKGAEAGGADVLSLINTLTGMKIDINRSTLHLQIKLVVFPVRQ